MKNRSKNVRIIFLAICSVFICLAGCNKKEEPAPKKEEKVEEPKEKKTEPVSENIAANDNLLTGVADLSEGAIGKRPVAVMVNNIEAALPQYGVSSADVIFEIPVEGDVTRLMALYGDYTKVPDVCSIRSCRYYYPILAVGFDAIYVHWGMDDTIAAEVLNQLDIDRLDGMDNTYGLYGRDQNRLSSGYSLEHTGYFMGTQFASAMSANGVRTDLKNEKKKEAFPFGGLDEQIKPTGTACNTAVTEFGKCTSTFTYDAASGTYLKQNNGKPHMDGVTNTQLSFKNVFILETDIEVRDDEGRKNVDWKGGSNAKGFYISNGAVQEIRWSKSGEYDYLKFMDLNGKEIKVNRGKSYIAFNYKDRTTTQ